MNRRRSASPGLTVYWVNQFSVPPDQPGGTRHYDMASELVRRDVAVTLVASDLSLGTRTYSRRTSPWRLRPIRERVGDVPMVWLSAGSYRGNDWRRVASMLVFGAGTTAFLLRAPINSDTVFVGSSPHLFAAFGTWFAAMLRRVPFVFEVRDLWPESYAEVSGTSGGAVVRVMRWMADLLYQRAAAIVVLAEPNADRIAGRGVEPSKIHYLPNGVDLTTFAKRPERDRGGAIVFVYAGAHGPANDLETAVRACALLEKAGESATAIFVGDGPSKDALLALASSLGVNNVEFRAPVPKAEIADLFASCDVGLMLLAPAELFTYGVSPNKLFDYLAANLPVVTNVPGLVSDIVEEAEAGLSCRPGDPEALAAAMREMASAIRSSRSRYANGREYIAAHYDRRTLAREFQNLLTATSSTAE